MVYQRKTSYVLFVIFHAVFNVEMSSFGAGYGCISIVLYHIISHYIVFYCLCRSVAFHNRMFAGIVN